VATAVPGFLPTVALTILAVVIVVIPVLIVGGALGLAFGLLAVMARLASRGFALVTGADHEPDGMVRTDPEAALH
jgi:hypothetical protein